MRARIVATELRGVLVAWRTDCLLGPIRPRQKPPIAELEFEQLNFSLRRTLEEMVITLAQRAAAKGPEL